MTDGGVQGNGLTWLSKCSKGLEDESGHESECPNHDEKCHHEGGFLTSENALEDEKGGEEERHFPVKLSFGEG